MAMKEYSTFPDIPNWSLIISVTAMQIIPEKIVILEKEYSRAYGEMKCSTNKEIKSHVPLF